MSDDILSKVPVRADIRIPYGADANQFGDLYLPGDVGRELPVVVFIHGGFWRSGFDLTHASLAAAAFAQAGLACWSIEYRRIGNPGGGWPGTFNDVGAAIDHLREIAPEHSLDLSRLVVAGHSAGGHLAAWAASRHRIPPGDPLYTDNPLRLKAAVPLAGVVDLRLGWQFELSDNVVEQLMGGAPEGLPRRYETASPTELLPIGVPSLLIHGTRDDIVPYEISKYYVDVAVERGDDARLITLQGTGHFEVIDPTSAEWPQVLAAVQSLV